MRRRVDLSIEINSIDSLENWQLDNVKSFCKPFYLLDQEKFDTRDVMALELEIDRIKKARKMMEEL